MINYLSPKLEDVFNIYFSENNLKLLTEAVSRLLKNPIAVYDSSYCIRAHSSLKSVKDSSWLNGMQRGYCCFEYAAKLDKLKNISSSTSTQIISDFGSVRRRQTSLTLNNEFIGYFSVLENETPFDDIPPFYYEIAAHLLAKELSFLYPERIETISSTHSILLHLLKGSFANRFLYRQRLSHSELNLHTNFRLLCIDMHSFHETSSELDLMQTTLSQILPASWSVYYESNVVVLVNMAHPFYKTDSSFDALTPYLESHALRCCVSDTLDDLYVLKQYYQANLSALEISESLLSPSPVLIKYDDYKLIRALKMLPYEEIPFICSAAVWKIYKENRGSQADYLITLYQYLKHEKSLQRTADELFVHRNTVAYRIQKISELYNIDFHDSTQNTHHYISCILLFLYFISHKEDDPKAKI